MLSKKELETAIVECENGSSNYQNCEKLATLYTIYDHLYRETRTIAQEETIIGDYGVSDFLMCVRGQKPERVWEVIDELMSTLRATNLRLYEGVMRKIAE